MNIEQKLSIVVTALADGSECLASCGVGINVRNDVFPYSAARDIARTKIDEPCYEDVLGEVLANGGTLELTDYEDNNEVVGTITLERIAKNWSKIPASIVASYVNDDGANDGWSACEVLQILAMGEVVYG